jgi:F0F1-type ATP synthase assembly protein I
MVDTSLAAFRLLELIVLLFPVVALLIQLQHRAADSARLETLGFVAGTSLRVLLSLSFLHLSVYLVSLQSHPSLFTIPIVGMSVLSLTLPALIILSSKAFTDEVRNVLSTILEESISTLRETSLDRESARSDKPEDEEQA